MDINIRADKMQLAEIFGRQVLYTDFLIPRDTIPRDWYCYNLRGTGIHPTKAVMLGDLASVHHVGTVLSPRPLKRSVRERRINDTLVLCSERMTLEEYCETCGLVYPTEQRQYSLQPAKPDDTYLFYSALDAERDRELACLGHLRLDFGRSGKEFWTTFHPHNDGQLMTPAFKKEFDEFVNELRELGPLKNLDTMSSFCHSNGQRIPGAGESSYGFVTESEDYRYCLRCSPNQGSYHGYVYVYDKRQQELNMTQQRQFDITMQGGI